MTDATKDTLKKVIPIIVGFLALIGALAWKFGISWIN